MPDMTLFEGIRTLRAVREFTDEPVSDGDVRRMLELAVCAPTLHLSHEREIRALLGIPAHVQTVALVPVGHPSKKHGRPRRIPAAERTHHERWARR